MTIKELYEFAKKFELEEAPIFIGYACDDDWYTIGGQNLVPSMVDINQEGDLCGDKLPDKNIFITIK